MAQLDELLVAIGIDDRDLNRAAARADRQFGRISRSADAMSNVGRKMTTGLTMPLLAVGASAIKTAAEFDKSLSAVEAVTGATAKELEGLEKAARDAAKGTSFTATQASDALTELGKTGFSATEAIEGLPPVLQLATAGQLEMARAADISSTIMNTMGLEAKDLNKVTDALAKGATSSATNVNQMGFAFARSAAASKAAGLSVNEATEAVALMAEAGFRGTAAGTGLNKILGALNTEGSKGADLFKKYGVELRRSDGSLRRLSDITLDAKEAGVEYNDVIEAFGLNHGPKFAAVLGLTDNKLKSVQAALEDTEGAGAEMAATMEDNLQGAFKRLQSAWEELNLTFLRDSGISDRLKSIVDGLAKFLVKIADLAKAHPKIASVGLAFLGVAATVGPLLVLLGFAVGQLRNLAVVANVARLAMLRLNVAFLANPVFLIAAGVALLAGAFFLAWKRSEAFRQAFAPLGEIFGFVLEILNRVKAGFGEGGLSGAIDAATAAVQEFGPKIITAVQEALTRLIELIVEKGPQIVETVLALREQMLAAGVALFGKLAEALPEIIPLVFEALLGFIEQTAEQLLLLAPIVLEALVKGLEAAVPKLVEFLIKVVPLIVKTLLKFDFMVLEAGVKLLGRLLAGLARKLPDVLDWIADNAPKLAKKAREAAPEFLKAGKKLLKELLVGLKRKAPDITAWIGNRLAPALVDAVLAIQLSFFSAGRDLIQGFIDGMLDMGGAVWQTAKGLAQSAWDAVSSVFEFGSPSKLMIRAGRDTGAGLAIGLRDSEKDVVRAAEEIARASAEAMSPKRSGMDRAVDELRELVESGRFKKQGSLLFEDVAFQGMSKNFERFHSEIADGFWNAVFEIEKAVKRGKKVTEAFTFEGMSKDVEKFGGLIGKLFRSSATARGASTAVKDFVPQDIFTMTGFADGGIATRPTVGMIGEAGEDEAVAPLSKLDEMIRDSVRDALRSQASSHTQVSTRSIRDRVGPQRVEIVVSGPEEMKRLIRKIDRTDGLLSQGEAAGV